MSSHSQSVFEPPNGFVLSAIRWNKLIVAVCALAMALAGVAYGLVRQPVYTASASLQIGQVNPNSPGFLGYVQSASSLATAFSRSIAAAPVLDSIERKTGVPPSEAISRLTSEPIPLSPVFRVIATGSSQTQATGLANAAADSIVVYESHSNSANPQAKSLLRGYRGAALEVQHSKARLSQLEETGASSGTLLEAEAEKIAAQVKLKAIGNAYNAAVVSQAPRSGLVTLLAGATSASNDRVAKIELCGFIGLLLGLSLGCIVAVLHERRQISRSASAPVPEAA
jgi:capsular polysaccharide biosynthesis protein